MHAPADVLLLHDGELSDVAALLDDLDVAWVEARSDDSPAEAAPLVIGTPAALLRWERAGALGEAARIAICDGGGRMMDRELEAHGVDFALRRPVHPSALRLLILHLVYRGPERRRLRRVNATLPVRYRAGWRPGRGLLLEFSVGGCRLLTDRDLPAGQRIKVVLPVELGLGRKLALKGRVVRCDRALSGEADERIAAIDFGEIPPDAHQRLAAGVVARARRAVVTASAPTATPAAVGARSEAGPTDRRRLPRGHYTKAVHGHIDHEQIVLMGSNLSAKGMQVDVEPRLAIGACLQLDLYGHGEIPPLRLEARVARDDGEQGLYLEFVRLWPGAPALIERLIKTLPLVSPGEGDLVISEVVVPDGRRARSRD